MTRIFLIGYMGAGKTTLGKALARELNLSFIDLDWYIEERFHKTVSQIFAERGEEAFRRLEQNMLQEAGCFEDVVISTGGGTPCFFDNMEFMKANGHTVFLNASIDVLFSRLQTATQSRPILRGKTDEELRAFIHEALQKRLPHYSQAHHTFNANELDNKEQITESVERLKKTLFETANKRG